MFMNNKAKHNIIRDILASFDVSQLKDFVIQVTHFVIILASFVYVNMAMLTDINF